MPADVVIKNGFVVDGTGKDAFRADVAVSKGKIAAVGATNETGSRVIDADGLIVAPGFWDMHTHYDAQLLWDPLATSSSWHGITTVVTGNCGFTLAPCRQEDQEWMMRTLARVEGMNPEVLGRTMPWPWEDFRTYLDIVEKNLGVNMAPLVGYNAVRRYVMGAAGSERATCTPEELAEMHRVLGESLDAGGIGLSTSRSPAHWDADLQPVPSRVADLNEYMSLISELKGRTAGYLQMSQGSKEFRPTSEEGLERLVEMVNLSGRPVCWNTISPAEWQHYTNRLEENALPSGPTIKHVRE
ncbi:amidohydrolase family protein, partial [Dehalococcoidia bacterium]|nr:amidohydrolase family protein [Dehalococcoidia bacterium]